MKIINVLDYGIGNSADVLETKKLQDLINQIKENCTIVFPSGKYLLSTIFLHSNLHFIFEKDCLILGSNSFYDYSPQEKIDYPLYQDASHSYFNCSLFVGKNLKNISFSGPGVIDMQSCWDIDNVRNIVHRGPKCFAFKECKNLVFNNFELYNATDLAIYFAGCENVLVKNIKMRVYIDGISPDNSKNVLIKNCEVESGDDGVVFKSSYTLNRISKCKNILVKDCIIKSRCNALKFGTETNGGFENIKIKNINIKETRICGIAIESVDGAKINHITIDNIKMQNVGSPIFIHLGKRMRGPDGLKIGDIKNIKLSNIIAKGPYEPYEIIEWNYDSYLKEDRIQYPWIFESAVGIKNVNDFKNRPWQFTSNICGLPSHYLKNIYLKNINLELNGGCKEYEKKVPEEARDYPEVFVYGKLLPAKGIYFRHIKDLKMYHCNISTINEDSREKFIFEDVTKLKSD